MTIYIYSNETGRQVDAIEGANNAEYGAWDDAELSDHDANLSHLLWLMCGDIVYNPK